VFNLGPEHEGCPLRNVSSHGISFRSPDPVKTGTKLAMWLDVPVLMHSFPRKFHLVGKVMWADKLQNKTYWRVGCRLSRGHKDMHKELVQFIRDGVVIPKQHQKDLL